MKRKEQVLNMQSSVTITEISYTRGTSRKFGGTGVFSKGNKDMKPVTTKEVINETYPNSEYFIALVDGSWSVLREDQRIVFDAFCEHLKGIDIDETSNSRHYRVFMIEYDSSYYYIRFRACGGNLYLYVGGKYHVIMGW